MLVFIILVWHHIQVIVGSAAVPSMSLMIKLNNMPPPMTKVRFYSYNDAYDLPCGNDSRGSTGAFMWNNDAKSCGSGTRIDLISDPTPTDQNAQFLITGITNTYIFSVAHPNKCLYANNIYTGQNTPSENNHPCLADFSSVTDDSKKRWTYNTSNQCLSLADGSAYINCTNNRGIANKNKTITGPYTESYVCLPSPNCEYIINGNHQCFVNTNYFKYSVWQIEKVT